MHNSRLSLFFVVALASIGVPAIVAAQDKLITLGLGVSSDTAGRAYTFNLSFNRTESADTEPGGAIWSRYAKNGSLLTLIPSAEANVGNGVEISSNNVLADVSLDYWLPHGPGQWRASLAPTITADKNFKTGLYYLRAGAERVWYNNPRYPRVFGALGVAIDGGRRTSDSLAATNFFRIVPHAALNGAWKSGLQFTSEAKLWNIRGDEAVISNGSRFLAKAETTYRFKKSPSVKTSSHDEYEEPEYGPWGITVGYTYGYDEPLFVRQNVGTIGVSFYR